MPILPGSSRSRHRWRVDGNMTKSPNHLTRNTALVYPQTYTPPPPRMSRKHRQVSYPAVAIEEFNHSTPGPSRSDSCESTGRQSMNRGGSGEGYLRMVRARGAAILHWRTRSAVRRTSDARDLPHASGWVLADMRGGSACERIARLHEPWLGPPEGIRLQVAGIWKYRLHGFPPMDSSGLHGETRAQTQEPGQLNRKAGRVVVVVSHDSGWPNVWPTSYGRASPTTHRAGAIAQVALPW